MMNETKRTWIYVLVAALSLGAASLTHIASRPKIDEESSEIGKEFYPEFQDPTAAQDLRVVAYDEPTASVKKFEVEYKNGKWRIPSHHNYPADGKDRLARTAASVIGTSRDALVSRLKSDQAKYNVLDPEDPDATILKGRGQKITIAKNDGTVLAEFVIGNKAEVPNQTDVYYVRATKTKDHDAIYKARLKIDLSTKFSDWIEPDLLKVDRDNLTDIKIDSYSIDERQGTLVPGPISELVKKPPSDTWTLLGIKPDEELKTDVVNQLVNSLDSLRLVGVRPKPQGVTADLHLDPKIAQSRELMALLQGSMANCGFIVAKDPRTNQRHIFSKEGELDAGTNEGVRYSLRFGQIFTGTEFEVETGLPESKDSGKKESDKKDATAQKDAKSEKKDDKDAKGKDQLKRSRYLMVYASFDPKLIGEPPVKPTEPKKPAGVLFDTPTESTKDKTPAAKKVDKKSDAKPVPSTQKKPDGKQSSSKPFDDSRLLALASDEATADQKAEPKATPATPPSASKPAAGTKGSDAKPKSAAAAKPAAPPKPDPKAEYEKAMAQYKTNLEKYENDKSQFENKLKKGKEKVKELNDRFGPWYYVISAESFENLHLSRSSLVKPKEKAADKKGAPGNQQLPLLAPHK